MNELESEGQNVRKAYQRRLPSDTSKDYYFMHRNTAPYESVIVEYGFLDSSADDVNQLKNNYENYSEAVVRAILGYINFDYQPEGTNLYTVEKGDSLWSIAKKFGITVDEIKQANNLTNNLLNIGQVLKIPNQETSGDNIIHIVVSGDTLYGIANRYGVTVDEIKQANNLTNNNLSIGQQLIIPTEEIISTNYNTYIVKSGDTLYGIARRYNTTVDELIRINNLLSNNLSVGQQILVPTEEEIIETPEVSYSEYMVKSGDSLYQIARRYNTTVDEIMRLNNLKTNLLSIGQVLKIPNEGSNTSETTYVVKSGDTLYGIANRFNTTVDEIISKNNLTSNLLTIGQILVI